MPADPEDSPALRRVAEAAAAVVKAAEYRAKQRLTAGVEARLRRDLAKAFRAQGAAFVRGVGRLRYQFPPGGKTAPQLEAVRRVDWEAALEAAMSGQYRTLIRILGRARTEAIAIGATRLAATLGVDLSLNLANPAAIARIAQVGADLVTGISETTRAAMRDLLTRATAGGWSYSRTATEIRATFDGFSRARAELIAVHETADAYEYGRASLVEELVGRGLAFEKSWVTAGDDRVDDVCEANESDGWIPSTETFSSGDDVAPAHPGCRCATTYQVSPDLADMLPGLGDLTPGDEG